MNQALKKEESASRRASISWGGLQGTFEDNFCHEKKPFVRVYSMDLLGKIKHHTDTNQVPQSIIFVLFLRGPWLNHQYVIPVFGV
jgi:hypothetical protein